MHVRYCDCLDCLPPFKAEATRVYRTKRRLRGYARALLERQRAAGRAAGLLQRARAK